MISTRAKTKSKGKKQKVQRKMIGEAIESINTCIVSRSMDFFVVSLCNCHVHCHGVIVSLSFERLVE